MLIQKDILFNTAKLFISKLVPAFLLTLINIIYSRSLIQSEYGTYQAIWSFLSVCVIFTSFGLPNYLLTFGSQINSDGLKKLIKNSLIVLFIVLVPITLYLFLFSSYFDFSTRVFFIILLITQTIYFVQEAFAISNKCNAELIWSNLIYSILLFVVHMFVLYANGFKLSNCVLGIIAVSILRNLLLWRINFKAKKNQDDKVQISSGLDFSLLYWLGLNDSLQILTKWLDKLLLLFLFSSAEYAIYYNGTFELPVISIVLTAFYSIITVYGSSNETSDTKRIELFYHSAYFMSGIIFPLFSWMVLYASPIVNILFSTKYEASANLFAISALFLPIRICSYTVLLQLRNQGKIILKGSIIDILLSMILMVIFYYLFKLQGLVLALVIATYVQAGYYLIQISKIYNVSLNELLPFQNLLIRLFISFSLIFISYQIGLFLSPLQSFIFGTAVSGTMILYFVRQSYSASFR